MPSPCNADSTPVDCHVSRRPAQYFFILPDTSWRSAVPIDLRPLLVPSGCRVASGVLRSDSMDLIAASIRFSSRCKRSRVFSRLGPSYRPLRCEMPGPSASWECITNLKAFPNCAQFDGLVADNGSQPLAQCRDGMVAIGAAGPSNWPARFVV
jgi:hypothetical protein